MEQKNFDFDYREPEPGKLSKISLMLVVFLMSLSVIIAGCTNGSEQVIVKEDNAMVVSEHDDAEEDIRSDTEGEQFDDSGDSGETDEDPEGVDIEAKDKKSETEESQEQLTSLIADGRHTEAVTYFVPKDNPINPENIEISITVEQGVITGATLVGFNPREISKGYQTKVRDALPDLLIGKNVDDVEIPDQISGSSLTAGALKSTFADMIDKY